jgi:hypothetical protein
LNTALFASPFYAFGLSGQTFFLINYFYKVCALLKIRYDIPYVLGISVVYTVAHHHTDPNLGAHPENTQRRRSARRLYYQFFPSREDVSFLLDC